jgi:NAD(P)-dependent dehydrogenase (short-subunit alcohol dehydrogenase family)
VADLNEEAGKKTVEELKKQSGNQRYVRSHKLLRSNTHPAVNSHTFIKCNVASWEAQVAMFKHAISASPNGGIDIVVANAGIGESDKDAFSLDGPKGMSTELVARRELTFENRAQEAKPPHPGR